MELISFRIKNNDNSDWVYIYHFNINELHYYMNGNFDFESFGLLSPYRDLNQREIYEGDVCKFTNHNYVAEVIYSPDFNEFLFDSHNTETINNPDSLMYFENCEIIGNIHDNPEILN